MFSKNAVMRCYNGNITLDGSLGGEWSGTQAFLAQKTTPSFPTQYYEHPVFPGMASANDTGERIARKRSEPLDPGIPCGANCKEEGFGFTPGRAGPIPQADIFLRNPLRHKFDHLHIMNPGEPVPKIWLQLQFPADNVAVARTLDDARWDPDETPKFAGYSYSAQATVAAEVAVSQAEYDGYMLEKNIPVLSGGFDVGDLSVVCLECMCREETSVGIKSLFCGYNLESSWRVGNCIWRAA